jgi:hypothetical protein
MWAGAWNHNIHTIKQHNTNHPFTERKTKEPTTPPAYQPTKQALTNPPPYPPTKQLTDRRAWVCAAAAVGVARAGS